MQVARDEVAPALLARKVQAKLKSAVQNAAKGTACEALPDSVLAQLASITATSTFESRLSSRALRTRAPLVEELDPPKPLAPCSNSSSYLSDCSAVTPHLYPAASLESGSPSQSSPQSNLVPPPLFDTLEAPMNGTSLLLHQSRNLVADTNNVSPDHSASQTGTVPSADDKVVDTTTPSTSISDDGPAISSSPTILHEIVRVQDRAGMFWMQVTVPLAEGQGIKDIDVASTADTLTVQLSNGKMISITQPSHDFMAVRACFKRESHTLVIRCPEKPATL